MRIDTNGFVQRAASSQKPLGNRWFINCTLQYFNLASWPEHLEAYLHKWQHTLQFIHQQCLVSMSYCQKKRFQNFLLALLNMCLTFLLCVLNIRANSSSSPQKKQINKPSIYGEKTPCRRAMAPHGSLRCGAIFLNSVHQSKPMKWCSADALLCKKGFQCHSLFSFHLNHWEFSFEENSRCCQIEANLVSRSCDLYLFSGFPPEPGAFCLLVQLQQKGRWASTDTEALICLNAFCVRLEWFPCSRDDREPALTAKQAKFSS